MNSLTYVQLLMPSSVLVHSVANKWESLIKLIAVYGASSEATEVFVGNDLCFYTENGNKNSKSLWLVAALNN